METFAPRFRLYLKGCDFMKRIVILFMVMLVVSFALVGCDSNTTTEVTSKQNFFEATVLSVNSDSLLVEPIEGTTERDSSDQIEVGTSNTSEENSLLYLSEAVIGDKIQIGYSDDMKESYPAQINEVFQITLIESAQNVQWARIPMVMINGKMYYDTGKESNITRKCGVMDGEITSTVDGTKIPAEDNQSNFGTGYQYQFSLDNTIEIYMNEKWCIFEYRSGDGSQIKFGNAWYNTADLSEETIKWLNWHNTLTEQEQLSINYIPADLLNLMGLSKSNDIAQPETKNAS